MVQGGKATISADKAAKNIEDALFAPRPRARYRFGMDSKAVCFLQWLLQDTWMDFALSRRLNHRPL